ncbi:hypothetical protein JW756_04120 [Candidatus Woesearchaeota archaeon]|nr:hypothetical protein [Candidatus Woesearchaeota archaeon]
MFLNKIAGFILLYALSITPTGGLKPQELNYNPSKPLRQVEQIVEECYADEVVTFESNITVDKDFILGKPDREYAWVLPRGEITVKMSSRLLPLGFYIDGRIVAKEGTTYSVAVQIPHMKKNGELEYYWQPLVPTLIKGGIDLPVGVQTGVDTIKIKNIDKAILYIDAVIGYCYFGNASLK